MPVSRALLLVSAVAGAVSVMGALFSDARLSAQGGLAMLVSLGLYVIVAGHTAAPRTRWSLAAGVGILAVVTALRLSWLGQSTQEFRWLTPFYAPVDGGIGQVGTPDAAVLGLWRQEIDRERMVAFLQLLAVPCFATGVFAMRGPRQPRRAALTAVLALLPLAVAVYAVRRDVDDTPVLDLLGTVWPALLATVVAAGLVALAGRRADRACIVAAGALLIALVAATALDDLTGAWSAWWTLSQPSGPAFVSVGISAGDLGSRDVSEAVAAAAKLAGPALLTIGALHAGHYSSI